MFKSKKVLKQKTVIDALKKQKMGLQSEKQRYEKQKEEVIEMIDNYDYFNDNVFTLLRNIKKTLNS